MDNNDLIETFNEIIDKIEDIKNSLTIEDYISTAFDLGALHEFCEWHLYHFMNQVIENEDDE
jgi:hypothetical protein